MPINIPDEILKMQMKTFSEQLDNYRDPEVSRESFILDLKTSTTELVGEGQPNLYLEGFMAALSYSKSLLLDTAPPSARLVLLNSPGGIYFFFTYSLVAEMLLKSREELKNMEGRGDI